MIFVFMSFGTSLYNWERRGLASRELRYYASLGKMKGLKVCLVTYGGKADSTLFSERYRAYAKNLEIDSVCSCNYPTRLQSLIGILKYIFLRRSKLTVAEYYKSKQLSGSMFPLLCSVFYRRPFVLRLGYDQRQFARKQGQSKLRRFLLNLQFSIAAKFADRVLSTSHLSDVSQDKLIIQPNWCDTEIFNGANSTWVSRQPTFLMVGRLSRQKNCFLALQAAVENKISLRIVGDGEERKQLESFARTQSVDCCMLGVLPSAEVASELSKSKFYLSTSLYEGNPKSAIEALATGCICIFPNTEGFEDLIEDGKTGFYFDGSLQDLKATIKTVLKMDISRLQNISSNAANMAMDKYSLDAALNTEDRLWN